MTGAQPAIEAPVKPVNRDTGVVDRDNPWPGLASFRESDREFFHGRDAAIQALTELVGRARASVLYGGSGLGKTSLIQAGLFPRARANDLFPVRIRLRIASANDDPAGQIRAALLREAAENRIETPSQRVGETLWEFFYRRDALWWNERHRIVTPLLVFDQFEEIFTTACRNPVTAGIARQFFVDLRGIILGFPPDTVKARCDADPDEALQYSLSRSPVRVLFSFREDYLAEFLELRDLFPAVADNDYRLLRMSADDALRVVLKAGRHLVEEPVARRIVEIIAAARKSKATTAGELPVDPALLSVFCRELNNERRSLHLPQITEALLKDKQATILENFYIRSLEGLDPRIRVFIENELLLPDSPERNSVAEQVALRRPGVTVEALESLITRRLLRRDERDGPARIELTHDVLIDPVRRSRDVRLLREADEQRLAAEREAEERARRIASRRRTQIVTVLFAALAIVAVIGWSRAGIRGRANARALAATSLVRASALYGAQGRNDIALAYLGYAANTDEGNVYARGKLVDYLLGRTWPWPVAIVPHEGPVAWAQFSPDGRQILSADNKGVRLWPAPPTPDDSKQAFSGPVQSARFSPSGLYILTISATGAVEVWDIRDRRNVRKIVPESSDPITAAAMDRTGTHIATGAKSGTLRLWEVAAPQTSAIWSAAKHADEISTIQFDVGGSRLLTSSRDDTARIWSVRTGTELASFREQGIVAAQFSPDGTSFVAASTGGWATLYSATEKAATPGSRRPAAAATVPPPNLLKLEHGGAVRSAQFSPKGNRILTASEDGTVRVWDVQGGGLIGLPLRHRGAIVTAFFDRNGSRIVTASRDKSARVWDAESGEPLTEPMWHERAVESATFSADGHRVVTASDDGTVVVWDVRPGLALPTLVKPEDSSFLPYELRFTPDGRTVLYASDDNTAHIWNTDTDRITTHATEGHAPARFSPDGTMFVTFDDRTAKLRKTESGELVGTPLGHDKPISYSLWSGDSTRIAIVCDDRTAWLWDARTASQLGTPFRLLSGDGPLSAALSDDSKLLAAAGRSADNRETVVVWDVSRKPPVSITEITAPATRRGALEFHPDNGWLLGLAADAVFVWPMPSRSGADSITLTHEGNILSAHFSPQGNRIVTTSADGTARIWKHPRGAAVPAELRHSLPIDEANFSRDGLRIVTASRDGTARLWESEMGDAAGLPLRHDLGVYMARFSADGERVVTASDDGVLRVWDVPLGKPVDRTPLALLAEAISGYSVADDRTLTRLDYEQRLDRQRQAVELTRGSDGLAARIVKWILEDRSERTISPFSTKRKENKAGGAE